MDKKNGRLKILFKDTGAFALGGLGSKILTFLLVPLYTNILSTSDYGVASLILTTVSLLFPILTLAISEGTLRFSMDRKQKKSEVLTISLLFNFGSLIVLFFAFLVIQKVSTTIVKYWWFFVFYYLGMALHDSLSQYLKGIGKTKLFAIQGVFHTFVLVIFNILFLVVFKMGLYGYLLATILGYFLTIIFIIFAGGIYKEVSKLHYNNRLMKEMLFYSFPMIPTIVAWWANSAIDKYVIVAIEGLQDNGLYSIAGKIPSILSVVTSLFTQAWQLSAINNCDDPDFEEYFNKIYYSYFVVSMCATSIFIMFNRILCGVLFSKGFYHAWIFVPFLLLSNEFSSLSGILASAFRAFKKTKTLFISTIVGAVVNLVLNVVLIKLIGTIGAAFATMFSFFVVWCIRMVSVQKLIRVKLPLFKTLTSFCISIVMALLFITSVSYEYVFAFSLFFILCLINIKEIVLIWKKMLDIIIRSIKKV